MQSDRDGDTTSSSGSRGPPAPVPVQQHRGTAAAGKGILVHSHDRKSANKKSANVNRVSFVAGPSLAASAWPSTHSSAARPRPHDVRLQQPADTVAGLPYHARTGRRLTGFGIKSYLHEFYNDPDDRRPFQAGGGGGDDDGYDYDLEYDRDEWDGGRADDDFKYCVEPTEIHWRRHCFSVHAVLGLAVVTAGAAAMAVGHLVPARDETVGLDDSTTAVDRSAVEHNEYLAACRYAGSVVFAVGVVYTVVRFWASVIRDGGGRTHDKLSTSRSAAERRTPRRQHHHRRYSHTVRIPVVGSVVNVQPDPRAISLRFDRVS